MKSGSGVTLIRYSIMLHNCNDFNFFLSSVRVSLLSFLKLIGHHGRFQKSSYYQMVFYCSLCQLFGDSNVQIFEMEK